MNELDEDRFWSGLGETIRPRLSEAQWGAQRARILGRLTTHDSTRPRAWVAAGALACLAAAWLLLPQSKTPELVAPAPIPGPAPIPEPAPIAQSVQAPEPEPPAAWDARVTMVEGVVTVFSKGADEGVPAAGGMPLEEGDNVRTGTDGRAELALSTGSVIALGPASIITLSNLKPAETMIDLDLGALVAKLSWKGTPGRRLDVRTPTAVAAVRGTEFGVTVQEGGETSVGVFDEGRVAVRTTDASAVEETMIEPHQEVHIPTGAPPETTAREGRTFLRVGELARLKPFREQIERIRERPEVLARSWKEMARPERAQVRSRMMEEHRGRMQALAPEQRQSMMERLRRPEGGNRREGGMEQGRFPVAGQEPGRGERPMPQRPEGLEGEGRPRPQRHEGLEGEGRPRSQRPEGLEGEGRPRPQRPEGLEGEGRPRPQRHEGLEGEGRPGHERQSPREQGGREQGPMRREPGRREERGMRPFEGRRQHQGGQERPAGGQRRERGGPGRERRN